ncbi:uncharacterized protein LOC128660168 [Bombina bombina]|uniref:uncharacterized protein LOC128660168 n=1 Tax=Bombina bombina TaxID=8345 RepID=UPI00235A5316|nr:uncharacterized protein LOC128660168 [Bombina bombina]
MEIQVFHMKNKLRHSDLSRTSYSIRPFSSTTFRYFFGNRYKRKLYLVCINTLVILCALLYLIFTMSSSQAGKTKSGRSVMFTHWQNCILVEAVIEHYDEIIGYQARTVNPQRKRTIWTQISKSVSAEGSFPKDVRACRKRVTDIRKNIKKKVCREKQSAKGTGGGPGYRAELTDFEQMLYARMGDAVVVGLDVPADTMDFREQEDEGRQEEEIDAQEDQPLENEFTSQDQEPSTSTVQREEGESVRALLQSMQDNSILLFEGRLSSNCHVNFLFFYECNLLIIHIFHVIQKIRLKSIWNLWLRILYVQKMRMRLRLRDKHQRDQHHQI